MQQIKGEPDTPVLYFGDFSAFKIQEVIGALEIQKLVENSLEKSSWFPNLQLVRWPISLLTIRASCLSL